MDQDHDIQAGDEDLMDAYDGTTLDFYIDYITHDVEADDWRNEARDMVVITPDGRMDLYPLLMDPCLEDPQRSKWKQAFVWRLIEKYQDQARVMDRGSIDADAVAECSSKIIQNWSEWDAEANHLAQVHQESRAYDEQMHAALAGALIPMLEQINGHLS